MTPPLDFCLGQVRSLAAILSALIPEFCLCAGQQVHTGVLWSLDLDQRTQRPDSGTSSPPGYRVIRIDENLLPLYLLVLH